jgi:Flp pilus assembly pilin Flp
MSLKVIASKAKAIWKDESAQGATEYILILVAVVVVAFVMKERLMAFVKSRLDNLGSGLDKFNASEGG